MLAITSENAELPLLDERLEAIGPVTTKLRRRALLLWLIVSIAGLALSFSGSAGLTAIGVGLVLPGGGLLYSGHPILAILTIPVFVVSLAMWLLIGAFAAPVIVWVGSALLSAALVSSQSTFTWAWWAVPLLALALVIGVDVRRRLLAPAWREQARALNAHLRTYSIPDPISRWTVGPALDAQEIGAMRFMLDLALQPIDEWAGFTTKDQFREAAWRYQLFGLSDALSALRATRMPAFRGYLQQAQYNACIKMIDRRVWSYWFWENLWGNLKINPEPMKSENIMLSGWYATSLGAYQITTGDRSFDRAGSLPFRWNANTVYEYDFPKIIVTLVRNLRKDPLMLYPCEPNWVFPYCNDEAMAGIQLYDRAHGTTYCSELLPTYCQRLSEEMTLADGRPVVITASRIGMTVPGSHGVERATSVWLRSIFSRPLAHRDWEQIRHKTLQTGSADLFEIKGNARLDPGDYTLSDGNAFFPFMMRSAREIGDEQVYDWAKARHDALGIEERDGALRWPGSGFANLNSHMGRFGAQDLWYRLGNVEYPQAWLEGPMLESASYPEVIVARALSEGDSLHLVLEPGTAGGSVARLTFSQLHRDQTYRVAGTDLSFQTDAEGAGECKLDLRTRMTLVVQPA